MPDKVPSGDAAYLQGRPCPRCAHVRTPAEPNPPWQCPRCGIAYRKFEPGRPRLAARIVAESRELASEAREDRSTYALIAANVVVGAIALAFGTDIGSMMLVYWLQGIIIGISYFVRLSAADEFYVLDAAALEHDFFAPKREPLTSMAPEWTFLLGIGALQAGILAFLLTYGGVVLPRGLDAAALGLCTLVFAANHLYSLRVHLRADRNIVIHPGVIMFLPFLRVLPIQLPFTLAALLAISSAWTVALFVAAKTAIDVLMHLIEHHEWHRQGPPMVPFLIEDTKAGTTLVYRKIRRR